MVNKGVVRDMGISNYSNDQERIISMSIYNKLQRRTVNYRKIYEQHYGVIPKDSSGRSYQIHHIDGDKNNNNIENLLCVSIEDHYQLHLKQHEYAAARLLAIQMNRSPEEISELSRKTIAETNQTRINAGTHHFQGPTTNQRKNAKMIKDGTHPFMKRADGTSITSDRIADGTHPFCNSEIQSRTAKNAVANGKNVLVGGKIQRAVQQKLLEEGKHFSQIKISCEYCNSISSKLNYNRWHGDRCKHK
jgi:hypothetical protein